MKYVKNLMGLVILVCTGLFIFAFGFAMGIASSVAFQELKRKFADQSCSHFWRWSEAVVASVFWISMVLFFAWCVQELPHMESVRTAYGDPTNVGDTVRMAIFLCSIPFGAWSHYSAPRQMEFQFD